LLLAMPVVKVAVYVTPEPNRADGVKVTVLLDGL